MPRIDRRLGIVWVVWVVIEDALATIALDKGGVQKNLVKHLRAEAYVAQSAVAVVGRNHRYAPAALCDSVKKLSRGFADGLTQLPAFS